MVFGTIALLFAAMQCVFAQASSTPAGVPVSMVVTVEGPNGLPMPDVSRQDVTVYQGRSRAKVTDWVPFQGDRAGLELFILLDDSPNASRGTQSEDIRNFIMAQAATTKVGVAYMQIGSPKIVQALTSDHVSASNAVRPSLASLASSASPYFSLVDLMKNWPSGADRREILMISNGIDHMTSNGNDHEWNGSAAQYDPYVDSAIEQAQHAGIIVFTISTSGVAIYLSRIADETGGGSYYQESGAPVSIAPYLTDSVQRLSRQYLLTFLAKPDKKGGMQSVKIKTEVPHAKLVSANKVYVPAAPQ